MRVPLLKNNSIMDARCHTIRIFRRQYSRLGPGVGSAELRSNCAYIVIMKNVSRRSGREQRARNSGPPVPVAQFRGIHMSDSPTDPCGERRLGRLFESWITSTFLYYPIGIGSESGETMGMELDMIRIVASFAERNCRPVDRFVSCHSQS